MEPILSNNAHEVFITALKESQCFCRIIQVLKVKVFINRSTKQTRLVHRTDHIIPNRFILRLKASLGILRSWAALVWLPFDISRDFRTRAISTSSMDMPVSGIMNPSRETGVREPAWASNRS